MVSKSDETAPDVPAAAAPGKPSPRRTSNMSQASAVSSRQSFASEYSYHESEGETPLKPCYDEADALAAALKESEQEEAFDRIAKQMEAAKIAEEGEAEEPHALPQQFFFCQPGAVTCCPSGAGRHGIGFVASLDVWVALSTVYRENPKSLIDWSC